MELKNLIYQAKQLQAFITQNQKYFSHNIDSLEYNPENNTAVIKGWAFSQPEKEPVQIVAADKQIQDWHVKTCPRPDVSAMHGLDAAREIGFEITYTPVTPAQQQALPLTLTGPSGRSLSVTAKSDSRHLDFSEWLEYSKALISQKGLVPALSQLSVQKNQNWSAYEQWLYAQAPPDVETIRAEIKDFKYKPKISIVVPVYNVDEKWLRRNIESVLDQYYENWELCMADDHSPSPHVRDVLSEYAAKDSRIKVCFRSENGRIAEATNSALDLATGDYIGFMDNDDELAPEALYEYVKVLNENEEADLLYCDEDFIDTEGRRSQPFFKSGWNPRLLLGHNYITHFVVVSRRVLEKAGRLRAAYDGSQDYDFLLRATPHARKVVHIPKILYHWRMIEGSVAENPEAKNYAYTAGERALQSYADRNRLPWEVRVGEHYGLYTRKRLDTPKVSVIVIANTRRPDLTEQTVRAVCENTDYPNVEIIAVNVENTQAYDGADTIKFFWNNAPLSPQELRAYAVSKASADLIAFVEAGAVPQNAQWLTEMVSEMASPDSGIVGGLIISPENQILDAGIAFDAQREKVLSPYAGTPYKEDQLGYYFRLGLPQNVAGVRNAALLTTRAVWEQSTPETSAVPLDAVERGLRTRTLGKSVIWTPNARFVWNGGVENEAPAHPEADCFYLNAYAPEAAAFAGRFTPEQNLDPYTNPVLKEWIEKASPEWTGTGKSHV